MADEHGLLVYIDCLTAEIKRLRTAFLYQIQVENECNHKPDGKPCRHKCGCALEMQTYIDVVDR
jgi:hypothetical protein